MSGIRAIGSRAVLAMDPLSAQVGARKGGAPPSSCSTSIGRMGSMFGSLQ